MSGLLAWAADVVGAAGSTSDDDHRRISDDLVSFTPEQKLRAEELDRAAGRLRRTIQDLRLRIPPEDLAQRLPHLHADSVASTAALALQLNAHVTTKEQAQQREIALQDENKAYENAISKCRQKIQEKLQEATMLQNKLKEMDLAERQLNDELEAVIKKEAAFQSEKSISDSTENELEASRSIKLNELEEKKNELKFMEERVQKLEKEWELVQQESEKKPSAAQREKLLEKQMHSLIEQLTAKQAQAERLVSEIHSKQNDFDILENQRRNIETGISEINNNRSEKSRFGRNYFTDDLKGNRRKLGFRLENQQRLVLLRSAFVIYVLALHVIVFIKLSF
ncbi:hypothetical protein LUZ60_008739 [Juncus effusus]|nr:hypothetical protein LUZ60_008739 [Juncus effusus]